MSDINVNSLANKLQGLELFLKGKGGQEVGYRQALKEEIVGEDHFMEVEVLKSLGDLRLQNGKLSKDSAEFDKAAGLYAAALLRCTDPDIGETLEHRIGYMEKLSRQLLQGYTPHFRWLSPDYWGAADSNVLRVAELFDQLQKEKGKATGDASQFLQATAVYKRALKRCVGPDTEQTLRHRIKYTEKIREKRKESSGRRREKVPPSGHQFWTVTRTDIPSQCRDLLLKGESLLASADLDSAEEHFAAALKMVHVRDPTVQQYQREVEPLCRLGDVYRMRGEQTRDGGDFVKAAALYNAAIVRSEDRVLNGNIVTAVREIGNLFLQCIFKKDVHYVAHYNTEKNKEQLKEMRDQIKLEMEAIDQQLDPYVHDEDNPCVKEIEAKRAKAVRKLFEKIAQQRKGFIGILVDECNELMGPPPCKYTLIGLGSQATGLVTPYSDLEFAILVEEESEQCLEYFRNLTHYLHLKVVNLGETILPALGIKSLNDFSSENPLDSWYYDSVTPRGFAFDGSMPKASKTPLGRQGTMNKPPSELICTPQNMVKILQNDATLYLKEGYHLATILKNPCLIAGDQYLIDTYMGITRKILQADGGKMAQKLAQETMREDNHIYNDLTSFTARLIDVKKEIYRLPSVAVDCLALSSCIIPTTVWETIEEMENQQVINPDNAHNLTVLTSISAELRLRTYIANGGQKENLSALASIETEQHGQASSLRTTNVVKTSPLKQIFYLPNENQLVRYYYTADPLKYFITDWSKKRTPLQSFPMFYARLPYTKAMMYSQLCKYSQAIIFFQEALKEDDESYTTTFVLLKNLAVCLSRVGDNQGAVGYLEKALQVASTHGQANGLNMGANPNIAMLLHNLGGVWGHLGDHRKAISYHEQALQIYGTIYDERTAHPDIADVFHSLGGAWRDLCDFKKAISYYEDALQMKRSIHGETTTHHDIAESLNSLGVAWYHLGDHKKAISYLQLALQMSKDIYGHSTAHPRIATPLNNLGSAWGHLGDHTKAISYYEQALKIRRTIYGNDAAHLDIATSLNNLGEVSRDLGDYKKAIRYHEEALQMKKTIYGKSTAHHSIAKSLGNLGSAWEGLGVYSKAISYYEQGLQIHRIIYGQTTPHLDIAVLLSKLGTLNDGLGDYKKAISYYEQALQICKHTYGQTAAHPNIASLLHNLGDAWHRLGDHRKAISNYEQALQMFRSIYGLNAAHPNIVRALSNLGYVWYGMSDLNKAASFSEEALSVARLLYSHDKSHPMIEEIEQNIAMIKTTVKEDNLQL
ncbi:uncharacterized protein LOC144866264 [Branchiostoma floridae x Branchiostoma japonicum]